MNAVIMDNVQLCDECIVVALSFIKAVELIQSRSLMVENPDKIIKHVSNEMLAWKTAGTNLYQQLPAAMFNIWKACESLRDIAQQKKQSAEKTYKPWNGDT